MNQHQTASSPVGWRLSSRDLALVASFTALIAALGLPGSLYVLGPVPITLQSLGIMLAGSILGWKRGSLSVIVLLVLVAAGLPLLSGGRGGLGLFAGPTAGFLLGYVAGAAAIGWMVERLLPAYPLWWGGLSNALGGIGVVYLFGIPGMAIALQVDLLDATKASLGFLPGDAIKVVIATAVASAVHRGYPGITRGRRSTRSERVGGGVSAR